MPKPKRKPTEPPATSDIAARAELVAQAKRVLPDLESEHMSDRELQSAVLKALQPTLEATLDGKSDAYVATYYSVTVASKPAAKPRSDADDVEPSARAILAGRAKPRQSTRIDARALPPNASARAILAGEYRIDPPPRVYETPDWRKPLASSSPRPAQRVDAQHPIIAAVRAHYDALSGLSARDVLAGRAPDAVYDAASQRHYHTPPHLTPLRESWRTTQPDAQAASRRAPRRT